DEHAGPDFGDAAVAHQDRALGVLPGGGIEQAGVLEQGRSHWFFAHGSFWLVTSASSTAMRTATPISTCSRISDREMSSATSESISTPRFIGPGCMISASGLAARSLSSSRP